MDIFPDKNDKLVHEADTGMQRVRVFDKLNGLRYMTLDGVQQGGMLFGRPDRLVLPYFKNALCSLAFLDEPARFLFVGLGMGAMPMHLRSVMPGAEIDIVELDPGVVEAARTWFGFTEDRRMRVTVMDGRKFIQESGGGYDVIFLDAYKDAAVPGHLATLEFMHEVKAALSPGGVAVANLWGAVINPVFGNCVNTIKAVFRHIYQLKSYTYNYIFIADDREDPIEVPELLVRAKGLKKSLKLSFDPVIIIRKDFIVADEETFLGEVNRD